MLRLALVCVPPAALAFLLHAVFAAPEVAPREPPRLELSSTVLSVGRLQPGEWRTLALPWRRRGVGTLRLLAVHAGCGCVEAQPRVSVLPPDAEGSITLRVLAPRSRGPFAHRVRVFTDARHPHDVLTCRIVGFVSAPVVCVPARLALGRCSPGRRVPRLVEVRWTSGSAPGSGREVQVEWRGVRGTVAVESPARRDVAGCLLRLGIDVPLSPGPFRGALELTAAGVHLTRLDVAGEVVTDYSK